MGVGAVYVSVSEQQGEVSGAETSGFRKFKIPEQISLFAI